MQLEPDPKQKNKSKKPRRAFFTGPFSACCFKLKYFVFSAAPNSKQLTKITCAEGYMDWVAQYLRELDNKEKHKEIFKAMFFPPSKDMKAKGDTAVLQASYTCNESSCDFSSAFLAVQNSEELSVQWKSKEACKEILKDISQHPTDYVPHRTDGYIIKRMGIHLVHLKREGADGSGVTGCVEYNELRKDSMTHFEREKAQKLAAAAQDNANKCTIM